MRAAQTRRERGRAAGGCHPTSEPGKDTLIKFGATGQRRQMPGTYAKRPVLRLNDGWAVGDDGQLQWFLLRVSGGNWVPRRFHVERKALLRSIRELCGLAIPAAVAVIESWPEMYRPGAFAVRPKEVANAPAG